MEYQKIINLLDNTPNQPCKFRTKSWVDYSDAYILVTGTITVVGAGTNTAAIAADRDSKQAVFKNCASFTNSITEINNTQIENAKDLDVVMPLHNVIEYSDNCSKTSRSLYQFCRDEPNNNDITESKSIEFKSKF